MLRGRSNSSRPLMQSRKKRQPSVGFRSSTSAVTVLPLLSLSDIARAVVLVARARGREAHAADRVCGGGGIRAEEK